MKIIFTGGTYVGKTSLVEEMAKLGYRVVPEAGIQIISELNELWGIDGQKQWRANNPQEFYRKIIDRQLELERSTEITSFEPVFLDRGVLDYVAFLRLVGESVPEDLESLVISNTYDLAFLCEALPKFDQRASSGRSIDRESSQKLQKLLPDTFSEYGCAIEVLPPVSLEARLKIVEEKLEKGVL